MSNTTLPAKAQRRARVRAKITGSAERPRLSVYVSNKHVVAQLIDDVAGVTIAGVSTVKSAAKGTLTEKAVWTGEQIAEVAKKHKVTRVVFDRGTKIYHGRLHALAEAARAKGLEF